MYVAAINEKEAIYLEESKEGSMRSFGGKKWGNDIIVL